MVIVTIILSLIGFYLLAGLIFAIPFLIKGVTAIDEGATGSKWGFRLIILPGTMVFWPLLLRKWIKAKNNDKVITK